VGSEGKSGWTPKVNSSSGGWVERFDPEGPKNPKGERRFKHRTKLLDKESDNGFAVWNSPRSGRTGLRGRSSRPNGFEAEFGRAAKEQARTFDLPMVARQRAVVGREGKAVPSSQVRSGRTCRRALER